jgi:hypothetical protein
MTLDALAARVAISRARMSEIELGDGGGAPLDVWFAIAQALGRYLKFEFARDPLADVADAGHLAIQELVIRMARAAGWEVRIEAKSRAWDSNRSVDVRLIDRRGKRIVIVECWNTFGDIGAAARSSNAKVRDEEQHAVAVAADGSPFTVQLVWVVRDTKANRELIARYPQAFAARLPRSSTAWLKALTTRTAPPTESGLVWCDLDSTRLFARRARAARAPATAGSSRRRSERPVV